VNAKKAKVLAALRSQDTIYQGSFKKLVVADKTSHEKFLSAKKGIHTKELQAEKKCQTKLASKLQKSDAKYESAYNKLMSQPSSVAAKSKLQSAMAALMKSYSTATSGKTGAALKAERALFSAKFKALERSSPYYKSIKHLRDSSAWYPKYKAQVAAYTKKCSQEIKAQCASELKLLKVSNKWFKDYSSLIESSAWFFKYKRLMKRAMAACHAKAPGASGSASKHVKPLVKKPPFATADEIHHALKKATKALSTAKTKAQKKAVKDQVKAALAAAGVADADNAGTIAWANNKLNIAKKWAEAQLAHDAHSLSQVSAWQPGQRKMAIKMRDYCENAAQAMIAVARSTKNKEMVARDAKHRSKKTLKQLNSQINEARKAAYDAQEAVEHARAALAVTVGDRARFMARHALLRANDAVHDAYAILKMEEGKKNVVISNRLESDGARLVGENELHYRARKTYHKAARILKLVLAALKIIRKDHYIHKEKVFKQQQKAMKEKAEKMAHKERKSKTAERQKKSGIASKWAYAAKLADEAMKQGNIARREAKKAAKAGKIAAQKALESAEVKADLFKAHHPNKKVSFEEVESAVDRESRTALFAARAAQIEDAIARGQTLPKPAELLARNHRVHAFSAKEEEEALRAREEAGMLIPADHTIQDWITKAAQRKAKTAQHAVQPAATENPIEWKQHYQQWFAKKMATAYKRTVVKQVIKATSATARAQNEIPAKTRSAHVEDERAKWREYYKQKYEHKMQQKHLESSEVVMTQPPGGH
jgi:hypothetical protein